MQYSLNTATIAMQPIRQTFVGFSNYCCFDIYVCRGKQIAMLLCGFIIT